MSTPTGELKYVCGNQYECIDCGTEYPIGYDRKTLNDTAFCNGHSITLCPWCRPDSAPWAHGRGV